MKERYIRTYGNRYVLDSPNGGFLMRLFHRYCEAHGMLHDNDRIFAWLHEFEEKNAPRQLSLWDE